jgi:hypothetical protein
MRLAAFVHCFGFRILGLGMGRISREMRETAKAGAKRWGGRTRSPKGPLEGGTANGQRRLMAGPRTPHLAKRGTPSRRLLFFDALMDSSALLDCVQYIT